MLFQNILLEKYNINPKRYFNIVKRKAKQYFNKNVNLQFSDKPKYKLMVYDEDNDKWIYFGSSINKDFIIYSFFDKELANKKRNSYLARSANIKGNWKNNIYSKNNLSRSILW